MVDVWFDRLHTADLYHIFNGPLLARRGRKTKDPLNLNAASGHGHQNFFIRPRPKKTWQIHKPSRNSDTVFPTPRHTTAIDNPQEKNKSNNSNKLLCSPSCEVLNRLSWLAGAVCNFFGQYVASQNKLLNSSLLRDRICKIKGVGGRDFGTTGCFMMYWRIREEERRGVTSAMMVCNMMDGYQKWRGHVMKRGSGSRETRREEMNRKRDGENREREYGDE